MKISLLDNWQTLLMFSMIAIAIFLIAPWGQPGVYVKYVDPSSKFFGSIEPGDVIYNINGKTAEIGDLQNLSGKIILTTNKGIIENDINFSGLIGEKRSSNLHFGLDVEGGLLAVVSPSINVSDDVMYDIKSILEKRMSSLRESSFQVIKYQDKSFIQIQIAGGTEEDLKKIINTTGIFEAKIPLPIEFKNNSGLMKFGTQDRWIPIQLSGNDTIIVLGKTLEENDTFSYGNVTFTVWNITKDRASIAASVYRNDGERKDIAKVYIDPKRSYIQQMNNNYYRWQFDVEVTPSASENFYSAVRNLRSVSSVSADSSYLESKIYLFLDNKEVNNLSIGSDLAKKPIVTATVSGASDSKESAKEEKIFLQTVLQSGALPTELEIVSLQTISPKLGQNFLNYTALAFIMAIVVVSAIIFIRYRNPIVSSLVILTCLSEIIIILGSSVVIGWTLDLAAIAGIIAVIGTGVDQQIMIVDEILMGERTWTMKSKIKRALFIVFGTAGTVLAAMLPLMLLGFGMLRGFAMTTSLGVLIAIFITRPAFTAIVEKVMNK